MLLGFNAQVIQLILLRETLILSSGSEVSLGISLAVWALFNGAGALAGWLLRKAGLPLGRFFNAVLLLLPLVLMVSIHLARISRAFVDVPGSEHLRLAVFSCLAVVVLAPVTFMDGLLFVSALHKLFGRKPDGKAAAFVYGTESLGSLLGGLVFAFVLVAFMDPFTTAGMLLCLNGLFLLTFLKALRVLFFVAGCLAFVFGPEINQLSEALRWAVLQPDLAWIESRETRYQNLAVLKYQDEYTIFGDGHLQFTLRAQSPVDSGDWSRAVYPNFAMLQHLDPKRVLVVGGSGTGYLLDLEEHGPSRLDWLEYDQALVELVDAYQIASEQVKSDRVHYHALDGRHFIKTLAEGSVDLILVDVPDPSNANLNRYYTLEFFQECARALDEGGVLVLGMTCQPNYIGEDMLARNGSVYAALGEIFPEVLITAGTFSYMAGGREGASLTADAMELMNRYEARGIKSNNRFDPRIFFTTFEEDDTQWIHDRFEEERAADRFALNRDDCPVAYFMDYRIFSAITSASVEEDRFTTLEQWLSGDGEGLAHARWWVACLPALGFLLFVLLRVRARSGKGGLTRRLLFLLAALTTGFCGIVLEICLLFGYQNGSGYLYSQMGVIIALYMAGLSLGALMPGFRSSWRAAFFFAILFLAAGLVGALCLLPLLSQAFPGALSTLCFYGLITLLVGASGGLSFRGVSLALEGPGGVGGALIYTMDILGTCLGGWQAGILLIPAFGIQATLLFAGGSAALLCFFCALSPRETR